LLLLYSCRWPRLQCLLRSWESASERWGFRVQLIHLNVMDFVHAVDWM
jgi:hypothetical protein